MSDVATDYFNLLQLDYELDISQRTLAHSPDSLRLVQERQGGGVATVLDLRQAEQLVETRGAKPFPRCSSRLSRPKIRSVCCSARIPDAVIRGQVYGTGIAAGSSRRPAVRAARAASRYSRRGTEPDRRQCATSASPRPPISRRSSLSGLARRTKHSTCQSVCRTAQHLEFRSAISQPIFTAGRLKSNVRLAEAERDSALMQYEKAIQTAFSEVSNALIAHQRPARAASSRRRWSRRCKIASGLPTCAIAAASTPSSTRSMPIATCFRPS